MTKIDTQQVRRNLLDTWAWIYRLVLLWTDSNGIFCPKEIAEIVTDSNKTVSERCRIVPWAHFNQILLFSDNYTVVLVSQSEI